MSNPRGWLAHDGWELQTCKHPTACRVWTSARKSVPRLGYKRSRVSRDRVCVRRRGGFLSCRRFSYRKSTQDRRVVFPNQPAALRYTSMLSVHVLSSLWVGIAQKSARPLPGCVHLSLCHLVVGLRSAAPLTTRALLAGAAGLRQAMA